MKYWRRFVAWRRRKKIMNLLKLHREGYLEDAAAIAGLYYMMVSQEEIELVKKDLDKIAKETKT